MIRGVGIDAVPVERMRRALGRSPRLAQRVFTEAELAYSRTRARPAESLAARFAAKEACRKALGEALPWRAIEVVSAPDRRPSLRVAGHGTDRFHLSLTHTSEVAMAFVVAETG